MVETIRPSVDNGFRKDDQPVGLRQEPHKSVEEVIVYEKGDNVYYYDNDGRKFLYDFSKPRFVEVNGVRKKLSKTDERLLRIFLGRPNRIIKHRKLQSEFVKVNGQKASDSYVRGYVKRLRRKLGDHPQDPKIIANVHGIGYIFKDSSHNDKKDSKEQKTVYRFSILTFDPETGLVVMKESANEVRLKPKETLVFEELAKRANELVSHLNLAKAVWPDKNPEDCLPILAKHIGSLRKKIGDHWQEEAFTYMIIQTKLRVGYKLVVPPVRLD